MSPQNPAPSSPVKGAFNQGQKPTIACFNQAKTPLGVEWPALIAALQKYIDNYIVPVWGTPATLEPTDTFKPGCWAMVFLEDADQPGALAYHDLTPDGWPLAKVFVRTTLNNGDLVSVSASHELVEMLVDPAINMMTTGPDPRVIYAYESADPVEALSFPVDDIPMSDFVFPAYFETFRAPGSTKFDYLGRVNKPFEILQGGYQIILEDNKWTQIYGSSNKQAAFEREDRRGHRSRARGRPLRRNLADQ